MITENLRVLREKIERKCADVNRDPSGVKLIAVSKNFGVDEVKNAIQAGVTDFGENRAQELLKKFEVLGTSVTWHFIGNLQKNKVKYVVKEAEYIHSVSSLSLAAEINKRAGKLEKVQNVLIQVKTSSEETKAGVEDETEMTEVFNFCKDAEYLNLIGLMTIAPFTEDTNLIRKSFADLRNLRDRLDKEKLLLKELSMGMTSDFEIAIEEGATMLRIGSAIFGERDYSKDWREQ